jgi:hypothetical protein
MSGKAGMISEKWEGIMIAILNVGITWISWGVAPGDINIAPLGLFDSYLRFPGALPQAILISPRWG